MKKKVILASSSPRRRMLLFRIIDDFVVVPPEDVEVDQGKPSETALKNAVLKGDSITCPYDVLIACDTLVALEGKIYGKPGNVENACRMLRTLSGKQHSVFSGVYVKTAKKHISFTVESRVTFRSLSDAEIIDYVTKHQPFDKAGSYGIQDKVIVADYQGDYDNIVGLPVTELRKVLKEFLDVKEESGI